jgi:hypothetical protein
MLLHLYRVRQGRSIVARSMKHIFHSATTRRVLRTSAGKPDRCGGIELESSEGSSSRQIDLGAYASRTSLWLAEHFDLVDMLDKPHLDRPRPLRGGVVQHQEDLLRGDRNESAQKLDQATCSQNANMSLPAHLPFAVHGRSQSELVINIGRARPHEFRSVGIPGQGSVVTPIDFRILDDRSGRDAWVFLAQPQPSRRRQVASMLAALAWRETPAGQIRIQRANLQSQAQTQVDQSANRRSRPQRRRHVQLVRRAAADQLTQQRLLWQLQLSYGARRAARGRVSQRRRPCRGISLANVEHAGSTQPGLRADLEIGQARFPQADNLGASLVASIGCQRPHINWVHHRWIMTRNPPLRG